MALLDRLLAPKARALYARLLLDGARDYWRGYAAALALLTLVSAATALMAWLMKDVINEIFIDRRADMIVWIALAVAGAFLMRGLATYFSSVILARIGNRIIARMQQRLFAHFLRLDAPFYDRVTMGDAAIRFTANVDAARRAIDLMIVSLGRDLLSLIGLVAVMLIQNPGLSLFALIVAPPAVVAVGWLTRRVRQIARATVDANARILSRVKEAFLGQKVVKAFGLEDRLAEGMAREVEGLRDLSDRQVAFSTLTVPMMDVLGGFAVAAVILFAGWRIASGASDPGAFFSFLTALLLAYEPARRLARLQVELQAHMVGVGLVYEMLDTQASAPERAGAALGDGPGRVRFEDVRFSYAEAAALNGLTLDCPGGKTTALVGPSGAGKSTVFELLTGMRAPQSGRVLIDGRDIATIGLHDLRARMALVTQTTFLFAGTLAENIAHGRPDADRAAIEAAARAANAHDFIAAKPGGYDHVIGEDGGGLSGGERQRIAIARAMLRDAPILLLDEATSALDAESEARVQEALARLMRGRTTLVIAHRLATVQGADLIHVLDAGRVVESGPHAALMARGGAYARLHALQFSVSM